LNGTASLRFYGWSPPTLSLGYFQSTSIRHDDPLLAALPFVRRPSGGDTLVHDSELTYAIALPPGPPWQARAGSWLGRMHAIIAAALNTLGVPTRPHEPSAPYRSDGPLCFHHFTPGDLLFSKDKIVGSAQRKHRGSLLQHGAILLARSAHAPTLPGIYEVTGQALDIEPIQASICRAFMDRTGWQLTSADWSKRERDLIDELTAGKYTQD